jgi:hypothetical protein
VGIIRTDVSEVRVTYVFRVERISELGVLAVSRRLKLSARMCLTMIGEESLMQLHHHICVSLRYRGIVVDEPLLCRICGRVASL